MSISWRRMTFTVITLLLVAFSCDGSFEHLQPNVGLFPNREAKDTSEPTDSAGSDVHHLSKGEQPKQHHPVIFVPGLGGSQLWAKLQKPKPNPHWYCYKSTEDYYNIWLSISQFLPNAIECWVDNFRLHYDPTNHTTYNSEGVDIQTRNFGDPQSVEHLDPFFGKVRKRSPDDERDSLSNQKGNRSLSLLLDDNLPASQWLEAEYTRQQLKTSGNYSGWFHPDGYFLDLAEALVAIGYKRGIDLRAAPYDFRKAPNEMKEFFSKTKTLIEDTYNQNGNCPVVIVGHSMGNLVMLYFYTRVVSRQWKDKYIRSHIALAAPWAGSVKSLKFIVSGDSPIGGVLPEAIDMRAVARTMPSFAWLMPLPIFWQQNEVLVSTPDRNYTTRDYQQLFQDLDNIDGYYMWKDTVNLTSDLQFPGVELHCLYSLGVSTIRRLDYEQKAFPDKAPKVVEDDDGDGTVNKRSLEACLSWVPVKHVVLKGVSHLDILKDKIVIQYVKDMATR